MSYSNSTTRAGNPVWEIFPALKEPRLPENQERILIKIRGTLTYEEARELQKAMTEEMER